MRSKGLVQRCDFNPMEGWGTLQGVVPTWVAGVLITLLMCMSAVQLQAQGRVVFEGRVESRSLGTNRMVRVYLPPSYEQSPRKRFPVLYVHDGQNAFTTVGDHVAFGWGNWAIDKSVTELSRAGRMQEIIVVAVDCSSQRYLDYRGPSYPYSWPSTRRVE